MLVKVNEIVWTIYEMNVRNFVMDVWENEILLKSIS